MSSSKPTIIDTLFQHSLSDLIKNIRLYSPDTVSFTSTVSTSTSSVIAKSLDDIRREIKSTDPLTKSTALLKLTYLNSLFFLDSSWAHFHIIEVISSVSFPVKKIGYFSASLSFNDRTDVILLLTNQLRKDLSSPNDYEVSIALNCLSVIGTSDLCRDLCQDVFVLLGSSRGYVRNRAVSVCLRVFRRFPDGVRVCFKRLVDGLGSSDSKTVCAVIGVFCELALSDSEVYLPLAPEFYKILIDCKNNWVLIKLLKIFAKLVPLEPRLAKKIVGPICEIMDRTVAKSVLFECIRTVVNSLSDCESAVKMAVLKIKEFLNEDDPNLKYLGLQALSDLSVTHSWAVLENKDAVMKALTDVDPNIKLSALYLLMAMVSEDNVAEITKWLVNFALKSDPEFCNEILRAILGTCCKDYYGIVFDFDWYVSLLGDMSRIPQCQTGEEIENQLVDIGMRVKDARPELVNVGRDLLIDPALLGKPYLHRILSGAAWVCGEYVEFSKNPFELMEALLQPRTNLLPSSIRAVYIQSVLKVLVFCLQSYLWKNDEAGVDQMIDFNPPVDKNGYGDDTSAEKLVKKLLNLAESAMVPLSWNHDVEVQERARNVLGIVLLVKEASLVSGMHQGDSGKKDAEITKLIYDMFAEEIGPVSVNAQARIPPPDGLALKEDLSDLEAIYGDLLLHQPTSFSLGTSHSKQIEADDALSIVQTKEDLHSSPKSETLLSQHRKRHGLYYLAPEKDDSPSTDYPPANDFEVPETEVDDLVKLTEQTLIPKKKRNPVKPRPVVVKLDEGENFLPTKKLEATADLLSGAVREILLNNEEVSTSSSFSEATAKQSDIRKGKEVADSSVKLKENLENSEIGNRSSKRSKDKSHGKERRQHTHGENDDGKEGKHRKEKKKTNRHSKHKSQGKQEDSNIVVKSPEIPDFLL